MSPTRTFALLAFSLTLVACAEEESADASRAVSTLGGDDIGPTPEELEQGRLDPSWRVAVGLDSTQHVSTAADVESWDSISAESVAQGAMALPIAGDGGGASVLRVQTLLDRAFFSPGVIDGRWGKNVEKAVYWLQRREGLPATGQVDSATLARMVQLAGNPPEIVRQVQLTQADVEGPFVDMPEEIYEAHELDCTCYESLSEKLGELFHSTPEVLGKLNPEANMDGLRGGDRLVVPAFRDTSARARGEVAEIVVSVGGNYLHALDASGRILYHFPTTLGSGYTPEEGTVITVNSITPDPWWNLQPRLLHVGDSERPPVQIPPGPNNAVGNIWIELSKEHYGIHGTARPETIGYATSSGCVRLTNWDANFLGERIAPGTPVRFKDIPPGRQSHPSHDQEG